MSGSLSDFVFFQHEGVNYQARYQFPSKVWFFYLVGKPEYFGSQYDETLKEVTAERAKEMLGIHIKEVAQAREFMKLSPNEKAERMRNKR